MAGDQPLVGSCSRKFQISVFDSQNRQLFDDFFDKIKVREQRGLKKLNLIQIMRDWLVIGLLKKCILV